MRKNTAAVLGVDVVKETVHKNKVETLLRRDSISRRIRHEKLAFMATSRIVDIRRIAIYTGVVCVSKVPRICCWTTAHIEDPTDLLQVIMCEDRGEFVFGKGSLPQPVSMGKLHDSGT